MEQDTSRSFSFFKVAKLAADVGGNYRIQHLYIYKKASFERMTDRPFFI